jgi:hypothetical protein
MFQYPLFWPGRKLPDSSHQSERRRKPLMIADELRFTGLSAFISFRRDKSALPDSTFRGKLPKQPLKFFDLRLNILPAHNR